MSHTTTINHLKLANCAIDQCYTSKQPLLAQVCRSVQLCLHCTTRQVLNIVYDTAIPSALKIKRNMREEWKNMFPLFNPVKLLILNKLTFGMKKLI